MKLKSYQKQLQILIKTVKTSKKNLYEINIWPGFVDVLGTLLIVTIFTVLISTVTQIYFNDQLEIKEVKFLVLIIKSQILPTN